MAKKHALSRKPRAPRPSSRRDLGDAFLPDPSDPFSRDKLPESDCEWLAAEMIAGATSGESAFEDARNEMSIEEFGGPYVAEAAVVYDTDEAVT
jgi:hypothetical protein